MVVTCPSGQAAAVARDRIAAIGMAAVTALTTVQPKCAVLWREGDRETTRPRLLELHTLLSDFDNESQPPPPGDAARQMVARAEWAHFL